MKSPESIQPYNRSLNAKGPLPVFCSAVKPDITGKQNRSPAALLMLFYIRKIKSHRYSLNISRHFISFFCSKNMRRFQASVKLRSDNRLQGSLLSLFRSFLLLRLSQSRSKILFFFITHLYSLSELPFSRLTLSYLSFRYKQS